MTISRYHGQPLPLVVVFPSDPTVLYGKTYADITDISMNLKLTPETDLDDEFIEKKQSTSGVVLDEPNHRFIMILTSADYTNLVKGETYQITVNVELSGITGFVEMRIDDRFVKIDYDRNRE